LERRGKRKIRYITNEYDNNKPWAAENATMQYSDNKERVAAVGHQAEGRPLIVVQHELSLPVLISFFL
jgi:hypothetical protein